ncbi:SH3 domain-containing protein [Pseudodesulfovibrio sp. JC047]|uniref:SH3 domain-containing protein n=1 Tax=Pseudodesulfovibrio sp. JC047 TaxID=2683199 RepID=UPI0013D3CDD0|nr:SH3 domain-containing protein [Pseudodesulfovibrio sp. JC047]NDV19366.1 SH3 domain-containing protein [Pseudodesulfovibrio sp. JC047]
MRKLTILVLALVSLCCVTANQGYAFGEIRYTDRPLNLRDARSPKATWVGNLYPGQKVRIAHLQHGWVAVYEPNAADGSEGAAIGYSNVKYLRKTRTRYEPKDLGELVYTDRTLNVRVEPKISSRKVTTLKPGTHVRIDFPEDEWIRVFPADATIRSNLNGLGYSSAKYFKPATKQSLASAVPSIAEDDAVVVMHNSSAGDSLKTPRKQERPTASAPVAGRTSKFVTATSAVTVYSSRTTGASVTRTVQPGETVQVGLLQHGWYAVFKRNELVLAKGREIGFALQSRVETKTRVASDQSKELALSVGPVSLPSQTKKTPSSSVATPRKTTASSSTPPVASGGAAKTITIDRTKFTRTKKPDPTPNKTAHGYQYRLLEKNETRQAGEPWITLKVFVSTTKKPTRDALKDFATTLWKEHRRVTKNVVVLMYLPGMDVEDLAYGVVKFDDSKLLEVWVREATLFGTKFL